MSSYGAWELKTGYQRSLAFGLVSSLLLFTGAFLAAYFLDQIPIRLTDSKKHTIRIKLYQTFLDLPNSFSTEPARPSTLPVEPPKKGRLMIDSLIQAPDLEWPESPLFANGDLSETGLGGIGGYAKDLSYSSADTIIDLDEFDLRPVILYKVDPKCPELARRGRITGTVTAKVLVGKNGLVEEVSIMKSTNEIFDDEVIAALKLWVFRPWVERNRCLPFRFTVMVEFVLR